MAKANRICRTCGTAYYYCPTCGGHEPLWKKIYDTEECMEAYVALANYGADIISAEEARIAIGDIEFVDENLKPLIDKLYADGTTKKTRKSNIVSEI